MTGAPAGPDLIRVIAERSAGNPFLATELYAREMMRIEVTDGAIAELTVYCTGDWIRPGSRAPTAVTLIRP